MNILEKEEETKTIVVAFTNESSAEKGIKKIRALGIDDKSLSLLSEGTPHLREMLTKAEPEEAAANGAAIGSTVGTVLGALGGVIMFPIAGFESLLASGLITSGAGAALGTFLGAVYSARFASQPELTAKDVLADGGVILLIDERTISAETAENVITRLEEDGDVLARLDKAIELNSV